MGLRFVCITALREIRTFHTIFTHNGVKILLNIYYNLLSFHQILSVEAFIFFTIFFLLIFTSYHVKIFFLISRENAYAIYDINAPSERISTYCVLSTLHLSLISHHVSTISITQQTASWIRKKKGTLHQPMAQYGSFNNYVNKKVVVR